MSNLFIKRFALLFFVALLPAQGAHAQETTSLSPSVVLVLKLVSATHVRPTTGIVISDNGLVMVPADFISTDEGEPEPEILILDGGTDILSNGRPATIVNRSIGGGLAILSVKGLKRPGFKLADNEYSPQRKLHLEAFPPAENIAKGADPLWLPLSSETPLPYVSGPVIDECGYLAGLTMTHGSQSLHSGTAPNIIFVDDIRNILDSVQLSIPNASCSPVVQQAEASVSMPEDKQLPEEPQIPEEQVPNVEETQIITDQVPADDIAATGSNQTVTTKSPVERPVRATAPPSLWRSIPWWLPVLAFIILAVSVWKGYFFFRLQKNKGEEISPTKPAIQPASDEPGTALLGADSDTDSAKPRSAPLDETQIPDLNALPDGCNGLLVVEGLFDADTFFKRYCAVNTEQASIIIGRGEVDISIENPAISRRHACIELDAETMTLSDSSSNNGTYINGIPCLPGEIMFIGPGDDISLGGVRVRISLIIKEAGIS